MPLPMRQPKHENKLKKLPHLLERFNGRTFASCKKNNDAQCFYSLYQVVARKVKKILMIQ